MPTGNFIAIGVNKVDKIAYGGWEGPLRACENDARDMAAIATAKGCQGVTLLTADATRAAVLQSLAKAADSLVTGDFLMVSYSGHGSQIGDVNLDEPDQLDETWCLYDGMLSDDVLHSMWAKFKPGVRILVFSDSCHSGTVTRMKLYASTTRQTLDAFREQLDLAEREEFAAKAMPFDESWAHYQDNKAAYDALSLVAGASSKANVAASVLLVSGCQDNQLSLDGAVNGLFTRTLKKVWSNGGFTGNYQRFHRAIVDLMPPDQTPNYFLVGAVNMEFESQKPFTV